MTITHRASDQSVHASVKKMDSRLVFATLADLGIKFSKDSKESI